MSPERLAPRRARPRIGWTEVALAAGIVALALLVVSSIRVVLVRQELAHRADALQAEISTLEDAHTRLEQDLSWSKSDAGVERLAREQLGWAKPGESAVVVEGLATARPTPTATPTPTAPDWRSLWGLLPLP